MRFARRMSIKLVYKKCIEMKHLETNAGVRKVSMVSYDHKEPGTNRAKFISYDTFATIAADRDRGSSVRRMKQNEKNNYHRL